MSDASCSTTAYLADGGFERSDAAITWDSGSTATGAAVGLDTTAANVNGGKRALKMVNGDSCGVDTAAFAATVPPSAGGAGPVLQFFYKAPVLAKSKLTVDAGGAASGNLPAVAAYTRAQICLDPTMAGQTIVVTLSLAGNADGLCASQPAEPVWFDDFAATTSPGCPTE